MKSWAGEANAGCLFGQGALDTFGAQMLPSVNFFAKLCLQFREHSITSAVDHEKHPSPAAVAHLGRPTHLL